MPRRSTSPAPGRLSDLIPDAQNANRGTDRGRAALRDSLRRFGAGRSILVDKHGRIIAGNKTAEQAAAEGLEEIVVVPSDGRKLVVVQRTDLDLETDPEAKGLAVAENRVAEMDLQWDAAQLDALTRECDGLRETLFNEDEWAALQRTLPRDEDWSGSFARVPQDETTRHRSMTLLFGSAEQVEIVQRALTLARAETGATEENPNRNGSAIVAICAAYLEGRA